MLTQEQKRIIETATIDTSAGKVPVSEWIARIAKNLPKCFRYKSGERKDEIVNHREELSKRFLDGGKKAVQEYVEQCHESLDTEMKKAFRNAD